MFRLSAVFSALRPPASALRLPVIPDSLAQFQVHVLTAAERVIGGSVLARAVRACMLRPREFRAASKLAG